MRSAGHRALAIALIFGIALVVIFGHMIRARAHDRSRPDLDGWFMSLRNKNTVPCCDGSDAMRLEDVDWDSKDGHYRVRLDGEWVEVPDGAVIEKANRAGQTLVWPYYINGALRGIRCFMPGSMT